jgi:hypothetical protein
MAAMGNDLKQIIDSARGDLVRSIAVTTSSGEISTKKIIKEYKRAHLRSW